MGQFFTATLWLLLSIMAWKMTPRWADFAFTFIVGITGIGIGSLLGLLASPYGKVEEVRFSAAAKAIGVLFSGYAVAKLDPVVVWLTSPDRLASNHLLVARALIFITALSTATVNMYVYRIYVDPEEKSIRDAK